MRVSQVLCVQPCYLTWKNVYSVDTVKKKLSKLSCLDSAPQSVLPMFSNIQSIKT